MVRNSSAPRMETTFYDEQSFHHKLGDVSHLKRTLTLDLNQTRNGAKRAKLCGAPVLSSPDLNKLKLGSPDLERLIISHNNLVTPTPTSHSIIFPSKATEEQESYVQGFVNALNELHHSDSSQGAVQQVELPRSSSSSSSSGATYVTLDSQFPTGFTTDLGIVVKDEPQTVPSLGSTPPLSPINMECQERIKLERKRQRNRVAASKCRRRKLERIARLEDKVKLLKGENTELSTVVNKLKEQVCQLKEQVMDHVQSGCQIMVNPHF